MTHEFKPGDKVRTKTIVRTVRCVDLNGPDPLLHFEDNLVARPQNVELVEPCVSHRELRAACLKVYAGQHEFGPDFVLGERSALLQLFFNVTGEELEMENEVAT
jgi:hypothetical protein